MKIKQINEYTWEILKSKEMLVPGKIYASKELMNLIKKDASLKQVVNVAKLPGILNYSLGMPDIHQGYGFSIGGVAAFDLDNGIISPGGVGFDINCGVRVLATNIQKDNFLEKRKEILEELFKIIPVGVGRKNKIGLTDKELDNVLIGGAEYAVSIGYGKKEDLKNCEENGQMKNADPNKVSKKAKERGMFQLGTLGAGNHFIEIQVVEEIFDEKQAKKLKLEKENIVVMIHSGSRGLGHQVASDAIQDMEDSSNPQLKDKQLVYAPFKSKQGQDYLQAMNCAVNYAFANRQIMMHKVREVLNKHFPKNKNSLVYDVCHNIAKVEEHLINGKKKKVCIHRKGATRCFENQPVIIPGSMGTASYILVGTKKAEELSFSSTAHGAGRQMSRTQANSKLKFEKIKEKLNLKNIELKFNSPKSLVEEAPAVYKDIEKVINVSNNVGLTKKIAKLIPLGVIKG